MLQYILDLRQLLRGNGWSLLWTLLLSVASGAMDIVCMVLLPVFLYRALFADAKEPLGPVFFGVDWIGALPIVSFTVAVVAAFVLRGGLTIVLGSVLVRVSEQVRRTVGSRITHLYLSCPFEQSLNRPLTHAMTVLNSYCTVFAASVVLPLLRLCADTMTIVAVLGFLLLVEPRVVFAALGLILVVGGLYYAAIRRRAERYARQNAELQAHLARQMGYAFRTPREVRIFQLQEPLLAEIDHTMKQLADSQASLAALYGFPRPLGEIVMISLALVYMLYKNAAGVASGVVISHMGLYAFGGIRILSSFSQFMANVTALRSGAYVTRLLAQEQRGTLAVTPPAARTKAHVELPEAARHAPFESLELRDVSFRYGGKAEWALKDISLRIRHGESVGVIGKSGAGKSSLADIVLGLLVPELGEFLINGKTSRLDNVSWWRTVGFVPQAVFIADDTLVRNIAYGIPDPLIDRARVERATELAQLRPVVAHLPHGLQTLVGDQGVRLSGGQRQRVAIARALYHQRAFLVLDEATSALDSQTERDVVGAITSLRGAVTMLIIAHRESTLAGCDRILELHEGELVREHVLRRPAAGAAAAGPVPKLSSSGDPGR